MARYHPITHKKGHDSKVTFILIPLRTENYYLHNFIIFYNIMWDFVNEIPGKNIVLNTKRFLNLVRRYADIQEFDAEIIREYHINKNGIVQ